MGAMKVSAREWRERQSEYLDDVLRGRSFEITRHGRSTAVVSPVEEQETTDAE